MQKVLWLVVGSAAILGACADGAADSSNTSALGDVPPGAVAGTLAATGGTGAVPSQAGTAPMAQAGTMPVGGMAASGMVTGGTAAPAGGTGMMTGGIGATGGMAAPTGGTGMMTGGTGMMTGGTGMMTGGTGMMTGGTGASGECVENLACTLAAPPSTGDPAQDCVDRINQFRTECACLPPLERWTEGEACADMMAEYDSTQPTAHAGFRAGICQGGSAQNECPGWRSPEMVVSGCLQGMWSEGPPPTQPCDGDCFQAHGHFINMTSTRSTKVACGFFTTSSGRLWAVQNFSR